MDPFSLYEQGRRENVAAADCNILDENRLRY